jgi:LytS/YehU family sensor histidine kinase
MNPHFLFNALNSIADFIRKNDLELADRYLTRFARLMRQTLEYSAQKEISLQEDLSTLELYLSLEQLRLNNAFAYRIEIDPDVDLEHTMVPPMLLQPFVENSIWHGFARISNGGMIHIHIKKEGDLLQYNVEDNGSGLDNTKTTSTAPREKKSMGVSITRERIAILNKLRSGKGGLNIVGTGHGTRVLLSIPFLIND